jgi:hypothetical protein
MNTLVTSTTIESPDLTRGLGHGPKAWQDVPKLTTGSPGKWSLPATTGANGVHSDEIPFGTSSECTYETDEIDEPKETKKTEETREAEERSELRERQEVGLGLELSFKIDEAIPECRVSSGDTNRPLFMLAHKVRSIEEELNVRFSTDATAEIVKRWQASNQDQLEKNHDYLAEFLGKLELVRFPRGRAVANALELARTIVPPKQTELLSPGFQLLAKLCCILQQQAGKKPFFLDGRSAAKVLGIPHRTVAIWLLALRRLDVIVLASEGHRGEASRYWYVA